MLCSAVAGQQASLAVTAHAGTAREATVAPSVTVSPRRRRRRTHWLERVNYEMIRGWKMEINSGDYAAQRLAIRFP